MAVEATNDRAKFKLNLTKGSATYTYDQHDALIEDVYETAKAIASLNQEALEEVIFIEILTLTMV